MSQGDRNISNTPPQVVLHLKDKKSMGLVLQSKKVFQDPSEGTVNQGTKVRPSSGNAAARHKVKCNPERATYLRNWTGANAKRQLNSFKP